MMIGRMLSKGLLLYTIQMIAPAVIKLRVMMRMTQRSQGLCLRPLCHSCGLLGGCICCCWAMATYPSALNVLSSFYGIIA